MAVRADLPLGFGEERIGDTGPAVTGRDVDLLGLVVGDHDEARHLATDDGNGRVLDSVGGSDAERLVRPDRSERLRDETEVAVAPAVAPDRCHCVRVLGSRRTDDRRGHSPSCLRNTMQALCPPKPNEFETPTWISDSRASFGM